MKKHFFFLPLIISLFLLSGCSQNKSDKISVNNPYEVAKGTSTVSYYDTEENIDIDGFTILDLIPNNIIGIREQSNNCIIVHDGIIRCIYIVDEDIMTYKGISVGDNIDKLNNTFSNTSKLQDTYSVIFNNNTEEDPANPNKEDAWIWITYYTDGSQIISIQIYDVKYGSELK